jgi:Domain of unknown function (DUF1737)
MDYENQAIQLDEVQAEYGILSADSEVDLVRKVNAWMANGWDLQGGVATVTYTSQGFPRFRYSQAIVHYGTVQEDEDPDKQPEQEEA